MAYARCGWIPGESGLYMYCLQVTDKVLLHVLAMLLYVWWFAHNRILLMLFVMSILRNISCWVMLEELATLRSEREMMMAVARYFQDHLPAKLDKLLAHLDDEQSTTFNECFLSPLAKLSSPLMRADGIPDEFSVGTIAGGSAICKDPEELKRLDETIAIIGELDPLNWQAISKIAHYWKESISNVSFLKSEIQNLTQIVH